MKRTNINKVLVGGALVITTMVPFAGTAGASPMTSTESESFTETTAHSSASSSANTATTYMQQAEDIQAQFMMSATVVSDKPGFEEFQAHVMEAANMYMEDMAALEGEVMSTTDANVARDHFVGGYSEASAEFMNSLHVAKDQFNNEMNVSGTAAADREMFNNGYNAAAADLGSLLEQLKVDSLEVWDEAQMAG